MKKFDYYTIEVKPENLDSELVKSGANGWELVSLGTVQRPQKILGQQQMLMQMNFLLIFKKEITQCQE